MKTIITLITATVLVAGITGAMAADRQSSDEAVGNELSWRMSHGSGDAYASARIPAGARASVGVPVQTPAGTYRSYIDFQGHGLN